MERNLFEWCLRWRGQNPAEHPVRIKAHGMPWKSHKPLEQLVSEFEKEMRAAAEQYYAGFCNPLYLVSFMKQAEQDIQRFVGIYRAVLEADLRRMAERQHENRLRWREREAARKSKEQRGEWEEELDN